MNNQKKKFEIIFFWMSEIVFKISGPYSKSRKMKVIGGKKVFNKSCRNLFLILNYLRVHLTYFISVLSAVWRCTCTSSATSSSSPSTGSPGCAPPSRCALQIALAPQPSGINHLPFSTKNTYYSILKVLYI